MKTILKTLTAVVLAASIIGCETAEVNEPSGERPVGGVSTGSGGGGNGGGNAGGGTTDSTPSVNEVVTVTGNIGSDSGAPDYLDACTIVTVSGETSVEADGSFDIEAASNSHAQTFFVGDEDENVYLMTRTQAVAQNEVVIDANSTALALVTLHPLFAPLRGDDYDTLVEMIETSPRYPELVAQIEAAIASQRDIFDADNEALLFALSNLIEDICVDFEEEDYEGSLDGIPSAARFRNQSKAIYENPKIYPLYAEINSNVLTLRNTGLTPSYFGTATHADGSVKEIAVKARDDYGGFDLFKTMDEINLGPECNYVFASAGECRFYLSRTSPAAVADFCLRLANSILSGLGLELGNDAIQEIGNSISRALIAAGSGVDDASLDPMAWMEIVYNATLEQLKTGSIYGVGVSQSVTFVSKFLLKSLSFYGKIKGSANAALRISYAITAPTELRFCLCYYDGELSTCSTVSLIKGEGDGQEGDPEQRLLEPLTVYVEALDEDGNPVQAGNYHRVKFEVVSGGGSVESEYASVDHNSQASTYWILGEEGEQKVRAVAVDMVTDAEISEPVYFTADLREESDITIRLDWHKLSGNTDIDLHVYDPFGYHIYYVDMSSPSGGWLDRDDVVGPGPEHIRWTDAPAGTYQIYVHFFGPDVPDITSYTVTTTVLGTTFQPVTGSIGYHDMVPIGSFTIGEDGQLQNRARMTPCYRLGTVEEVLASWNLPAKN